MKHFDIPDFMKRGNDEPNTFFLNLTPQVHLSAAWEKDVECRMESLYNSVSLYMVLICGIMFLPVAIDMRSFWQLGKIKTWKYNKNMRQFAHDI